MKWLGQLSIKDRLTFAMITAVTVFLAFGIYNTIAMNNLGEVTTMIYEDPLKVSNAAIEARVDIIKIQNEIKDLVLSDHEAQINTHKEEINILENHVLNSLDIIRQQAKIEKNKDAEREIRDTFLRWRISYTDIIDLTLNQKHEQARNIASGRSNELVEAMDARLKEVDKAAKDGAGGLVSRAKQIETNLLYTIITLTIVLGLFFAGFFTMIIKSILNPIKDLKETMDDSTITGKLTEVSLEGDNEISDIAKFYNLLIQKLKDQFWIKDGQNLLNKELSAVSSVDDLAQRALNLLIREVDGAKGAFYLFDKRSRSLQLQATFAFIQRDHLSNSYGLGEGIIGQVALEKKPIFLKNIHSEQMDIETGLIKQPPLNSFTFPLIYEDQLYGVIELASFEVFDKIKQEFLMEAEKIIAINLYSVIQSQRIKDLLEISENAQRQANINAQQLQSINSVLEDQQQLLQKQTAELQQSNAELEEQQQLLQLQSEELHQTNAQLEEQQQLLEEKSRLLNIKNQELESSREELLTRSHQLEMANKYKSEFLANMSHELRTPLNSIILLSKLLMKNNDNRLLEDDLEKTEVIHRSGKELLRLINDVLDLSKVEAGKMDLYITRFPTSDIVEEMQGLFSRTAEEKNLAFKIEDNINDHITGDRDKISQILRNLISNAIKFTSQGLVTFTMDFDNSNQGGVYFKVKDTGIGISPENLSLIFMQFQQGDGSISRKFGGTGLGLSISKKLAKLMDGEIEVSSTIGVGSTFSLYLKDALAACDTNLENQIESIKQMLDECAITEDVIESTSNENRVILVVENKEDVINSVTTVSDSMGFDTLVANDIQQGMDYIQNYNIQGILLSLSMGDSQCVQILEKLKDLKLQIPVIVYTGQNLDIEITKEIDKYIPSIVMRIANSKQVLLDEMTLFLYEVKKREQRHKYLVSKTNKQLELSLDGKKILIVDDDPRNIFVLAAALEDFGAEIIDAENGKAALTKLHESKIDLVLMDIMMPVMDGFKTMEAIRNDERIKDVPIIAITAKPLKEDREKCIAYGANDYISKPVDYEVLIRLVKAWINK